MTLKKTIWTAAMLLTTMTMSAADAQWNDVTKKYVKSAAFDGDSYDGWEWESNASTQQVRVECISFYSGNFDLHQQLRGLPKGKYRLTVQGFYRMADNETSFAAHNNGTEDITASLYADNVSKKLMSLYSASIDYNAAGRCFERDGKFYPDGKEAALAAFEQGLYVNTLEFEAEGSVTIGVRCGEYEGNNYCVLDNFKLEYQNPVDEDGNTWIDMTSQLLKNPGFDENNSEGWTYYSGANNIQQRSGCMEFWNGWFYLFQPVEKAPKGKYRMSVQSYYRCQDNPQDYRNYKNGTQHMTGMMFAQQNESETMYEKPIVSVYSDSLSSNVGGCWSPDNNVWYPNTMESASYCFNQGYYWNTMEFEAEGDFVIGLYNWNEDELYSNWCIFDNFKLEYYGKIVKVESIELGSNHTDWVVGEIAQLTATVKPENATIGMVEWSSSNTKVATVDENGMVTAVGQGTATITAKAIDGSGVKGTLTIKVGRNQAKAGSLIINEIMASNVDEFVSPAFNFDGWIEVYNPTDRAVELGGLMVSHPSTGEGPWKTPQTMGVVPAKGFGVIWFDSNNVQPNNAPFKLDVDGGTIVISDANGKEIVRQDYPASMERVSYARVEDETGEWGMTDTPTPGMTNKGIKVLKEQLAAPVVNQPSKLFTGSVNLSVEIPAGTTLRYTTDGTLPTRENGQTGRNGQFKITETSNYRFRLFADDKLASPVTTRSFIKRTMNYTLPVVSVVCDWDFLYSSEIGVMTTGPNGRPGNGQSQKCNWNMDWERPVNFSYLTADGEMVLNQDVNLEMCGGWSRAWYPHSFKLKGSKEMGGNKNLPFTFFDQKPYIRNRTLQIRNGGNDNGCRIKDASLQTIVATSGIDIDYQSYQPVHEFINGNYIGVLNMREPNNKHYVYANYGWDDDEIDQFEISPDSNYVQKCGTADAYEELLALSANAADPVTYNEICTRLLDIDAYINYMAVELYLGNNDWPKNNIKGFRHRDGGKFRFVLFDLDHSFNSGSAINDFMGKERWTFDRLYPSGKQLTETITFVTLFKNLLKNENFRKQFIDVFCLVGGSVFEKDRSATIIDELVKRVEPAMNLDGGSSKSTANTVKGNLRSRLATSTSSLKGYSTFGLNKVTTQSVTLSSDTEGAQLFVNGLQVPTGKFNGNLFAPVVLKAQAPIGYAFKGWLDAAGKVKFTDEEITMPTSKVVLKASFEKLPENEARAQGYSPVRINEVSGSNDSYIDEYGKKGDWVELYNASDKEVDVEGMYLTDNLDKPEKYQITKGETKANTKIPAHGYLIIWCDKRTTSDAGLHASFKIDGDGGVLALMAADKSWKDVIAYGAHDMNSTVVRFPDGGNDVFTTNVVTIGKTNVKTSYMTKVDQTTVGISSPTMTSAANGFRLRYGSGLLFVKSEVAQQAVVDIYNAEGQLVEHAVVEVLKGSARVDVSHLPSGFYVARAVSDEGTRVSCKFMK